MIETLSEKLALIELSYPVMSRLPFLDSLSLEGARFFVSLSLAFGYAPLLKAVVRDLSQHMDSWSSCFARTSA